jgi:hypothetical protein
MQAGFRKPQGQASILELGCVDPCTFASNNFIEFERSDGTFFHELLALSLEPGRSDWIHAPHGRSASELLVVIPATPSGPPSQSDGHGQAGIQSSLNWTPTRCDVA